VAKQEIRVVINDVDLTEHALELKQQSGSDEERDLLRKFFERPLKAHLSEEQAAKILGVTEEDIAVF
jgi:hypothetical protein